MRLLNRFPGGLVSLFRSRLSGLDFTKPLLYTLFLGSEYAVGPTEQREELRYDQGRRKGVGSEGWLRPDGEPVVRFRGCPGQAEERLNDRFPIAR